MMKKIILGFLSLIVLVFAIFGLARPTVTSATYPFQFFASKSTVLVREKFTLNWVWDTLSTTAQDLTMVITVPPGISLNWTEECRWGTGCQVVHKLYNTGTASQTVVTDAEAFFPGYYLISTYFEQSDGLKATQSAYIHAGTAPILPPSPTATPTPTATPGVTVDKTFVALTLIKDYQSPTGLTMANALTITSTGADGWQLYNNNDAYFLPVGGTNTAPVYAQGFGFYEVSGGLTSGSSVLIHAYVNNNLRPGLYGGSHTLQALNSGHVSDVQKIYYQLTVQEPNPTPTTIPTLTPTPTPTVKPNTQPIIATTSLPNVKKGRSYWAQISAYDRDLTDTLTMTTTNLPNGLTQDYCSVSYREGAKWLDCSLTGKTFAKGSYQIKATVQDNRGGSSTKYFWLRVN